MHLQIYKTRPDVNAICHTHSMYATTFAVLNKPIPAVVYEIANLGVTKSRIPVAPYGRPGTTDLSDSVIEPVQEADVFLLQGHGAVAVSQGDIYDAYLRAAYIEELAQLYYNALCAGQGEEPYFFPPEELQKWEYPSQIKFPKQIIAYIEEGEYAMKKIINQPDNYIKEMLEGIYIAHKDDLACVDGDLQVLVSKHKKEGKVGIVTGGGSGHLPLFLGYVGKGMIDGCAVGDVFQSPSVDQAIALTRDADQGAGVLYIYGNYNGDIFTFRPAADEVEMEDDIETAEVLGADDVASAGPSAPGEKSTRRGVAGIFFVYKCAGAAADKMLSLEEVKRVADKANNNVRTMGVALSPCTVPRVGKPSFEIEDDEMEIGMGIHGEPGIRRGKLEPADQIVDEMLEKIVADLPYENGDEVAVLVNGLGATPLDEQYIVTRRINQVLEEKGISVYKYYVGEYATAIEMAGFSISLLKLDDELKEYIDHPVDTPFFKQV